MKRVRLRTRKEPTPKDQILDVVKHIQLSHRVRAAAKLLQPPPSYCYEERVEY